MTEEAVAGVDPVVWILVIAGVLVVSIAILYWPGKGLGGKNPSAELSLLAGGTGVLVSLLVSYIFGGLLGLAAIYLGNSGRSSPVFRGLAIAGIVLGVVSVGIYILGRLVLD